MLYTFQECQIKFDFMLSKTVISLNAVSYITNELRRNEILPAKYTITI